MVKYGVSQNTVLGGVTEPWSLISGQILRLMFSNS